MQPALQPIPTSTVTQYGDRKPDARFAYKTILGLGICQLVFGVLSAIFQPVSMGLGSRWAFFGTGIWCGAVFFITGCLGIVASVKATNRFIIAYMVLSIISALLSGIALFGMTIATAIDDADYAEDYSDNLSYPSANITFDAILALIALVEMTVAIISSVLCSIAICCHQNDHMMGVVLPTQGQLQNFASLPSQPQQVYPQHHVYPQQQLYPQHQTYPQQQHPNVNVQLPPPSAPQSDEGNLHPQRSDEALGQAHSGTFRTYDRPPPDCANTVDMKASLVGNEQQA